MHDHFHAAQNHDIVSILHIQNTHKQHHVRRFCTNTYNLFSYQSYLTSAALCAAEAYVRLS